VSFHRRDQVRQHGGEHVAAFERVRYPPERATEQDETTQAFRSAPIRFEHDLSAKRMANQNRRWVPERSTDSVEIRRVIRHADSIWIVR
jgi:hypothetical protein